MKQTKLRRRRVIRYAILYLVLLVVFVAIMVGPGVAGKHLNISWPDLLTKEGLIQPTGLNNDDTEGRKPTGTGKVPYTGVLASQIASEKAAKATAAAADRMMLLI